MQKCKGVIYMFILIYLVVIAAAIGTVFIIRRELQVVVFLGMLSFATLFLAFILKLLLFYCLGGFAAYKWIYLIVSVSPWLLLFSQIPVAIYYFYKDDDLGDLYDLDEFLEAVKYALLYLPGVAAVGLGASLIAALILAVIECINFMISGIILPWRPMLLLISCLVLFIIIVCLRGGKQNRKNKRKKK